MQGGDQDTALQAYDRALQLDANNVDAYVARGAAFANQRDFSRAVADFETALGACQCAHYKTALYLCHIHVWCYTLDLDQKSAG